ncbi:glycosyl transferase family 1 [Stackebrandtia albiflava]|uniref:Glycosyl transferase family 1 n=1 Tax=Stackebrandtia albiflava TaxID=406432 RepID=A0A562VA14_9ACTN|nr:glycosyltransferase [Stackebrandtia albiflava]TWJ14714.1 glycosyl transferase family 1 [Stackebrandtia albiflava]
MTGTDAPLNILMWHVHGSWSTSFVQSSHRCLIPVLPEGAPWGLGRAGRPWPDTAVEVTPAELADTPVDLVILQRPEELALAERWLGRRPGIDVPAVYVEHNTPVTPTGSRHPVADRRDIPIAHVTHFNRMMWDNGDAPCVVVPHGIVDPGYRYTGEIARAVALINEPVRRNRVTGTDLLPLFGQVAPVDVFGIHVERLADDPAFAAAGVNPVADLGHAELHPQMAARRVYLHTARWTSLGLSLLEAMTLGMPVVAVASTEAPMSVPPEAGAVSADVSVLQDRLYKLIADPDAAVEAGRHARDHALRHFGLQQFLTNWDNVIAKAVR